MEVSKEPDLLDGWWTSEDLFSLERRAIFSKTWICIAHSSRFHKPGDYISLDFAGFPILIILGKDKIIRAFHNVCRHRAYTITKKAAGSSLVLGCRYHGWSYDTKGSLVKAPQFDGIEGFERSENSLFGVHTCTDRSGFVHVNMNAGRVDYAPEYDGTGGFAGGHDISVGSKWLFGWELTGEVFNWKTIGANDRTGIGTHTPSTTKVSIAELFFSMFSGPVFNVGMCQRLLVAPGVIIFAFPGSRIWVMMTILPASAAKCNVKCDAFATENSTRVPTESEKNILQAYCQDFVQNFEQQYKILKREPLEYSTQLQVLQGHLRLEQLAGHKIYPARTENQKSESFCKAEQLCNDLDRKAKLARVDSAYGALEW